MLLIDYVPINVTIFPDNTSQVWKLSEEILKKTNVTITWKFESEEEFLHLAQLKCLLDKYGIKSNLKLTYLPYARQDKEVSNDRTFALRPFAKLLNSLSFEEIFIMDPHSNVALELINSSVAEFPELELASVFHETKFDLVCYPDKGAVEKYSKIYDFIFVDENMCISGEKIRDQQTGQITNYQLIGDAKGKTVLIVDDICDGGSTFIHLSKALYEAGAKEVNLFVTHGIFSKGLQVLKDAGIKRIFTEDGEHR